MKEDASHFPERNRLALFRQVWASIFLASAVLVIGFIGVSKLDWLGDLTRVIIFGALVFACLGFVIARVSTVFSTPVRTAEVALTELSGQLEAAESNLTDEGARVQAIWNNVVDGLVTINSKGQITAANPATCRIFGYEEADLVGQNVKILASGRDRVKHDSYVQEYNRSGNAKIIGRPRKVVGRRADGSDFPVDLAVAEMKAGKDRHYIGVLRDLTDQAALEEQLRHSQRLEAVGQLTGGIAHDFNNLLAVIEGNLGLLVPDLKETPTRVPEDALELSEGALHAAKRGAELTRGLLAFSRKQALNPQDFDPNLFVGRMEPLLRRTLGEPIDLQLSLKTRGWQTTQTQHSLKVPYSI